MKQTDVNKKAPQPGLLNQGEETAASPMTECTPKEAYENLANAIVAFTATEYMQALKRLSRKKSRYWEEKKAEYLEFFHSDWYRMLTNMDADALIGMLDAAYVDGDWIDGHWVYGKALTSEKGEWV